MSISRNRLQNLLQHSSQLSLDNKLAIYNMILQPESLILTESFQSKRLRTILDPLWQNRDGIVPKVVVEGFELEKNGKRPQNVTQVDRVHSSIFSVTDRRKSSSTSAEAVRPTEFLTLRRQSEAESRRQLEETYGTECPQVFVFSPKEFLGGKRFLNDEELKETVEKWLSEKDQSELPPPPHRFLSLTNLIMDPETLRSSLCYTSNVRILTTGADDVVGPKWARTWSHELPAPLSSMIPPSFQRTTVLHAWCRNWKIRGDTQKYLHVTFTLHHSVYWRKTGRSPTIVTRYLGHYVVVEPPHESETTKNKQTMQTTSTTSY
ncbi:hypothetical protein AAG570_000867 [Ranatra chinensis]|uniref:Uncharacterized protein n=1 Tax=Ranatra chinensis TaxID=642074 RepID=A0ABD0ZLL1_9HEMI